MRIRIYYASFCWMQLQCFMTLAIQCLSPLVMKFGCWWFDSWVMMHLMRRWDVGGSWGKRKTSRGGWWDFCTCHKSRKRHVVESVFCVCRRNLVVLLHLFCIFCVDDILWQLHSRAEYVFDRNIQGCTESLLCRSEAPNCEANISTTSVVHTEILASWCAQILRHNRGGAFYFDSFSLFVVVWSMQTVYLYVTSSNRFALILMFVERMYCGP